MTDFISLERIFYLFKTVLSSTLDSAIYSTQFKEAEEIAKFSRVLPNYVRIVFSTPLSQSAQLSAES